MYIIICNVCVYIFKHIRRTMYHFLCHSNVTSICLHETVIWDIQKYWFVQFWGRGRDLQKCVVCTPMKMVTFMEGPLILYFISHDYDRKITRLGEVACWRDTSSV